MHTHKARLVNVSVSRYSRQEKGNSNHLRQSQISFGKAHWLTYCRPCSAEQHLMQAPVKQQPSGALIAWTERGLAPVDHEADPAQKLQHIPHDKDQTRSKLQHLMQAPVKPPSGKLGALRE